MDGRRSLHLPRLSRVRDPDRGRGGRAARGVRLGPRHPARHRRAADLRQLRAVAAGGAAAGAREEPAQPDEGELAGDRAPSRLPRLRRGEAVRRIRRGVRRAAVPRALHPHRLQRQPVGDPRAPAEGSAGRRALGPPPRAATTTRRSSTSSRRTRATSCSRSRRTSSSRLRSGSSTWASAGTCGCSSAATRSSASSPAWSTCRASASSTENRQRIQDILQEAFGGTGVDYTTRVSESVLARLHVVVYTEQGAIPEYDVGEIEARLAAATRAWTDDLREALSEQLGEERAGPLFERYGDAFPGAYREDFSARQAVLDIERIERLDPDGDLGMSLYVPLESTLDHLAFKLLRSGQPLLLSDVLPLLENMGVRVSDERPYEIKPAGGPPVWIYDFGLRHDEGAEFQADDVRATFQDAFARTWRGEAENDGFNRLVLSARLTAREITILRAIAKYLRQAGSTFSQNYMEDALSAHPDVARRLVELFRLRLDPVRFEDTDAKARALERELEGHDRRRREPRRGSDPARLPARRPSGPADELLPDGRRWSGEAVPLAQAGSRPRPGPARAAADVRGLRLLAPRRGGAPPRRAGRARRHPLVRPPRGLPHRGARADEGPDGQERRDRPGRRQGRLRRQAASCRWRPRCAARGGRRVLPDVHARPARRDRHDRRRQDRAAAGCRSPRRGRPVPRRRRRQGHGDLLGHRERNRDRVRLLARRRVRLRRLRRLRPQADGDHGPRGLGVGQAPLPRAGDRHRDHRLHRCRDWRHVRRRVRQRHAALPSHPADRRVRPPARLPRSESGRGGELRRAPSGSSSCRAPPGRTTTRR